MNVEQLIRTLESAQPTIKVILGESDDEPKGIIKGAALTTIDLGGGNEPVVALFVDPIELDSGSE